MCHYGLTLIAPPPGAQLCRKVLLTWWCVPINSGIWALTRMLLQRCLHWTTVSDPVLGSRNKSLIWVSFIALFLILSFSSPDTATVPSAPHGATDRGELCPFRSLWQWPAQRREPSLWQLRQRLLGRSL